MIVFWGEPPGKPLQVPPLTTAPEIPYMTRGYMLNTMSIKIQSWPHRQPPCSAYSLTGRQVLKSFRRLVTYKGWWDGV